MILRTLREHGLLRPPGLQTDDERTASRLELFFDLAFVLVLAELAGRLREDVGWHGTLVFAGLFATVWWAWTSATLYANRFDHDDVLFRLYKLGGMAAVIGLAASAAEATGARLGIFVGCQVALRLLLLLQYGRAHRHVEQARPVVRLYLAGTAVGTLLWAVSPLLPRPVCFALWAAAVLVEAVVPLLVTRAKTDVPLHLEHLPERFALLVILVLGESIAAIANGLIDAEWTAPAVAVAVVSFVLAAGLWWSYFDLAGAGAKRLLNRTRGHRSEVAHDVYVFGQLPLCLALAAIGAGIELGVVEGGRGEVPPATRLLLAGGVALYFLAMSATNSGMSGRWRSGWWWPAGAAAIAALDATLQLPAVVVIGGLALLVLVVVAIGTVQRATGRLAADPV
ncbi:low temperature requirement protein A [Geodermatophilus sp. URMC 64]